jgi:AraC-like DNA-binding protein
VPIRQRVELGGAPHSTMSASVRECIYAMLPSGLCSADSVASRLGVDRRTVHRHLAREGKTFSAIMDSARAELVTRYIENRDRPLASVAELLGFSALSAFSRWSEASSAAACRSGALAGRRRGQSLCLRSRAPRRANAREPLSRKVKSPVPFGQTSGQGGCYRVLQ